MSGVVMMLDGGEKCSCGGSCKNKHAEDPAYVLLDTILKEAYNQAASGKGKDRHAVDGEAFEDQPICEVARRVGLGYPLGQAVKKIYESGRLEGEAGVRELLGAIVYISAAIVVRREGKVR